MDERYENILREAGRLFLRLGLRNLSMDDVSRELGISKKTLYQYFENKADLIGKILQFHGQAERQLLEHLQVKVGNAIDFLLDLSKVACFNMNEFKPSVTFELKKYYPEVFRKFIESQRDETRGWISRNLRQGIEEGLYRPDLDIDLTAAIYIQNLENLFDHEFLAGVEFPFDKLFQARFENHIRSIATTLGLDYFEKRKAELDFGLQNNPGDITRTL